MIVLDYHLKMKLALIVHRISIAKCSAVLCWAHVMRTSISCFFQCSYFELCLDSMLLSWPFPMPMSYSLAFPLRNALKLKPSSRTVGFNNISLFSPWFNKLVKQNCLDLNSLRASKTSGTSGWLVVQTAKRRPNSILKRNKLHHLFPRDKFFPTSLLLCQKINGKASQEPF